VIKKIITGVFLCAFLLALVLPMFFINTQANKISATENRRLSNFPLVFDESGKLNHGLRLSFISWLNDNIGFRSEFVKIYATIKFKFFRISPSPLIHIGKDGWYYYTGDQNIEIARGTYYLPDEMLETIAYKQKLVNQYYTNKNIDYFLITLPSKSSIYPEYVQESYHIRETPVDIVEHYLKNENNFHVINPKKYQFSHKDKGKLFLKQDFHWTSLGSYYAYAYIIETLSAAGAIPKNTTPVEIVIAERNYGTGEVAAYLGCTGLLSDETAPDVQWDKHGIILDSGEYFDKIMDICNRDGRFHYPCILENPNAENGTLLIYGDSQFMPGRNIPQYFAEHFKTVVYAGIDPHINQELEDFVKPDIVLYETVERYINYRLPYFEIP
jgi:hypothetical protein